MAVPYYGDFPEDAMVYIPFNTFTSDDPSASVTITNLADTDIYYHKNGSITDYSADAATAVTIDFDGITGNHMCAIDTSENAYFATGSEIAVRMEGTTVDGATINAFIGAFSIERAGGVLELLKAGTTKVDVETIKTQAVTCGAGVTVRADVGAAAAPGAANGMFIGGTNAATTVASLSCTGQLDAGSVLVDAGMDIVGELSANSLLIDTTTTLTGNVSCAGTFDTVGAWTAGSVSIDAGLDVVGELSANSVLVDVGTVLTGAVTTGAITADALSVTNQLDAGNVVIDAGMDVVGALSANSLLIDTTATVTGNALVTGTMTHTGAVTLTNGINVGALSGTLAAGIITGTSLHADACTKIIDDFETQSAADPTGFKVNIKEINDVVTQLEMLMDASTTINADADLTGVVVDKSILSHVMTPAANTDTYRASTDSMQSIRDAIAAAADVSYNPDASSTVNTGDETNAYTDAAAIGGNSWQIADANGDAGARHSATSDYTIDAIAEFNMGANRIGTELRVVGYFNKATGGNVVEIYAYNYVTTSWDKLSIGTVDTEMRDDTGNQEYDFSLHSAYTDQATTPGEVKIGFVGTDSGAVAGADVLYLDYIAVSGSAVGGTTPQAIAAAVHTELDSHLKHIPSFTGDIYYVSKTGSDDNSGHTPDDAFLTIGAATTAASAGDQIHVKTGTYSEAITLAADGLELICEIGAIIDGNTGVPLTVSANMCEVISLHVTPDDGQIGIVVSGNDNYFELCTSHTTGTSGFQVAATSKRNEFVKCIAQEFTGAGFDIKGFSNTFLLCLARGDGGSETGFHLSNTAAHRNLFDNCVTIDCATAGWDCDTGADDNLFNSCSDSAGCGAKVDDGANNSWRGFGEVDSEAAAALNTAIPGSPTGDSINDYVMRTKKVTVNKMEIIEANGNTVVYEDDSSTPHATVATAFTSNATTTTRLKLE